MSKEKMDIQPPLKNESVEAKSETGSMSISGHLSEIKSRLTWIILTFVASVIACSFFVNPIVEEFVKKGSGFNFIYISPAELVTSYVKIALLMALVITSPIILYQLWGFVLPALKQSEKRMGLYALLGGTVFFVLGAVFAYFVAAPFTIHFFAKFDTTGLIAAQISFESYIDFLLSMLFTFGIVFEMPMLTLFLSQIGIVKPTFLIKTRKYAFLLIFIIGAFITPPDVVSQFAVSVPMVFLYEISILLCRINVKRKESARSSAP